MIGMEMILTLFDYNYWANDRILACAANVGESSLSEPVEYGRGSLRELLFHMFLAEWIWRVLCQERQIDRSSMPRKKDYRTLDEIKIRWSEEEGLMRSYIGGLSEGDLAEIVEIKNWRGELSKMPIWNMLTHIIMHSMQHRSEAAELLTKYDQSPGDLDFIFFIRE